MFWWFVTRRILVCLPGIEIWWREGVDSELSREISTKGVVLMCIASSKQDSPINEEIGGGMVDSGDISSFQRLPSVVCIVGGVFDRGKNRI
jgi:hypothetical protein